MSDPGICWTFSYQCPSCGNAVQVTNGVKAEHPDCAPGAAVVISGCTDLVEPDPWDQLLPDTPQ